MYSSSGLMNKLTSTFTNAVASLQRHIATATHAADHKDSRHTKAHQRKEAQRLRRDLEQLYGF